MTKAQQVVVLAALAAMATVMSGCGGKDAILKKWVSPAAIDGFITVDGDYGKYANENCASSLQMSNITGNIWWPGCGQMSGMADFDTCDKDGCVKTEIMEAMDSFNDKYGGKLVTYKSRAGKTDDGKDIEVVDLAGWWLPAPNAKATTPRIVIQHGFTSNSNKYRQMFVAYLLRKLGFSVLVNNLRDHCYSDDSKHGVVGWGHAYPMDTLGAWDFAKDHAAAPIDASKVGILGFSMGAFTTNNAFGLEAKVPAVWVDGGPITPKAGFEKGFEAAMGSAGFAAPLISDDVWKHVEEEAEEKGIDLNEHLPEKQLPEGPDTKRPVFVTANKKDATVPFSSSEALVELLKKYPQKYDLVEFWELDGECDKQAHCMDMMMHTDEYESKLCSFWSGVFKTATCGQATQKTSGEPSAQKKSAGPKKKDEPEAGKNNKAKSPAEPTAAKASRLYEKGGWIPSASSSLFAVVSFAAVAAAGLVVFVRRVGPAREAVLLDEEGASLE